MFSRFTDRETGQAGHINIDTILFCIYASGRIHYTIEVVYIQLYITPSRYRQHEGLFKRIKHVRRKIWQSKLFWYKYAHNAFFFSRCKILSL